MLEHDTMDAGYKGRNFDKFMDVDFPKASLENNRMMGALPRETLAGEARPVFEDVEEMIPVSEWPDRIREKDGDPANGIPCTWLSELITWVCDQNGEGSCVSNATIKQHEVCQARQFGRDKVVRLSPISLYEACGNSPGSGSTLDRNVAVMQTRGCLPLDTPENRARFEHVFKHNGYYDMRSYLRDTPECKATMKLFIHGEMADIRSKQGMGTALFRGYPILYARQSHSILSCRLFYRNGKFVWGYDNSWGRWGDVLNADIDYGMGYDSDSVMNYAYQGASCLRSVSMTTAWEIAIG